MEDVLGKTFGHLDDRSVVSLAPSVGETGAHGLGSEHLQLFSARQVAIDLAQQILVTQRLQIGRLVGIGHIPTPFGILEEILFQQIAQLGQGLVLGLVELAQKLGLDLLIALRFAFLSRFQLTAQAT